jgi:hypothetical protein
MEAKNKSGIFVPILFKFRVDGCKVLGGGKIIRNLLMSVVLTIARKFGKFPYSCPVKKVYLLH